MKTKPVYAFTLLLAGACASLTTARAQVDNEAYHQAVLNYKAGNYAAARLAIDDAETAQPNTLAIAVLKARILTEQKDFSDGETLLHRFLGPDGPLEVQLALGDLYLRAANYTAAANMYDQALRTKADDPDIELKLVYARINSGDLVTAGKYAAALKPLDPDNPAYYFARAALAESTGQSAVADQDIETARTIYGIDKANRYLKTYLQVTSSHPKTGLAPAAPASATNRAPKPANP